MQAVNGSEGPTILRLLPFPQPFGLAPGHIYVELKGNAESFEVRVYTEALTLAQSTVVPGPAGPGNNYLPFDASGLAAGAFFLKVTAIGQGKKHSLIQKLYLIN